MKAQEFVEEALKKNKNLSTMTYGFWYEMMEAYLESRMPDIQTAIENALHATNRFDEVQLADFTEGIMDYIKDELALPQENECKRCHTVAPLKDGLCYGCACLTEREDDIPTEESEGVAFIPSIGDEEGEEDE